MGQIHEELKLSVFLTEIADKLIKQIAPIDFDNNLAVEHLHYLQLYTLLKHGYNPIQCKFDPNDDYLIFSGIGNPNTFKRTLLKNKIKIVKEIIFPDHYQYKKIDIEKIKHMALKLNLKIITTEKDFVKISKKYSNDINFLEIDIVIKKQNELISLIKSIL